jgi:hypothetical protein
MWSILSPRGKDSHYEDAVELPEDASLEEENRHLRRRLALTEKTLERVRGERAKLNDIRNNMKRNSRLRRQAGGAVFACYLFWVFCWNMRFLGFYNALRGRPRDCAVRPYGALILEGGGVKGIAYGGAAAALETFGLLKSKRIHAFAGTSAGSMMGALMAARAPARDVTEYLLNFPFEKLMDGSNPVANVGRLQRNYGWFKGDEIELRMRQLLSKTVGPNITFGDLEKRKKTRLRLSATDITAGRHAWLDAETAANVSVASAVRASSAIPFVYPPVVLGGRLFVDGGLLRNIPWDAFGTWGVTRRKKHARDRLRSFFAPFRARAVLALSIRGPERVYDKILSDRIEDDNRSARTTTTTKAPNRGLFGIPLLSLPGGPDDEEQAKKPKLNTRGFAGLMEFGSQLVDLVTFGADSPNALPADHPTLDVVKIDPFDISAGDFNLDDRARAHLVASGYVAVTRHLAACGHGAVPEPPAWLVDILANFSGGASYAPSLRHDRREKPEGVGVAEAVRPTPHLKEL